MTRDPSPQPQASHPGPAALSDRLLAHLRATGRLGEVRGVRFLAAGEYNANYLAETNAGPVVLRVNYGSQLGLAPGEQIAYEFAVLRAAEPSGVTPKPLWVEPRVDGADSFPGGLLAMEYIPGEPLDYHHDLTCAARVFAAVHALTPPSGPVGDGPALIRQPDPVAAIAAESLGLIRRFPDHPRPEVGEVLEEVHGEIVALARAEAGFFAADPLVLVNTEVNSGNFKVSGTRCVLLDWEKGVVSSRYQDLGHFVTPTTTRWKAGVVLDPDQRATFLAAYRAELLARGAAAPSPDEIAHGTAILERTILLRALAWCYMAFYEYTCADQDRTLRDPHTLATITAYLDEAACLLGRVSALTA